MSQLKLFVLGTPWIQCEGTQVNFERYKDGTTALLIYLAIEKEPKTRDALVTLFFPERPPNKGHEALRQRLFYLNRALPGEWIKSDHHEIGLQPDADMWVDATKFNEYLQDCDSHSHTTEKTCSKCVILLEKAVALYRGHFMSGLSLAFSPEAPAGNFDDIDEADVDAVMDLQSQGLVEFEDWQSFETQSLKIKFEDALRRLVSHYRNKQNWKKALDCNRRLCDASPFNESHLRSLMQLFAWSGDRKRAKDAYNRYEKKMRDDGMSPPKQETQDLYEQIKDPQQLYAMLEVIEGPGADVGKQYRVGVHVQIGRGHPDNDIDLAGDGRVSRKHATIRRNEEKYWLTDENSSNGTHINEKKLKLRQEEPIRQGATIRFGETHMVFYEIPAQPSRPLKTIRDGS